jgi:hypothetical protein
VSSGSLAIVPSRNWQRSFTRQRRLLVAIAAFLVIFIFVRLESSGSLSYFELSSLSTNTGALALAAMGETVVFLLGGIDLSAGATLSLVNVTLASQPSDSFLSQIAMVFTGLAIGGLVGAFNGFFVAYMRLQAVGRASLCADRPLMFARGGKRDGLTVDRHPGILVKKMAPFAPARLLGPGRADLHLGRGGPRDRIR